MKVNYNIKNSYERILIFLAVFFVISLVSNLPFSGKCDQSITLFNEEAKSLGLPKKLLDGFHIKKHTKMINSKFFKDDAQEVTIKEFRNKITIISFCSLWSLESRVNIQKLSAVAKYFENKEISNIAILVVFVDFDNIQEIKNFYKDNNITNLTVYTDKNRDFFTQLELSHIPTTFIIDKDSFIIGIVHGYIDWYNLDIMNFMITLSNQPISR